MLKFYVWVEISNVENIILMSLVLVYNEYLLKLVHNNEAFATLLFQNDDLWTTYQWAVLYLLHLHYPMLWP